MTRQDLESAQKEIQDALTQLEAQEKESKEKMQLIRLDVSNVCVCVCPRVFVSPCLSVHAHAPMLFVPLYSDGMLTISQDIIAYYK